MHGEVPKQVLAKPRSRRRTYVIGLILIAVAAALVYYFAGSTPTQRNAGGRGRFAATDRCRC